MNIGILGTGSYLPEQEVTNEALMERVADTTPEWISRRTLIEARRFAADGARVVVNDLDHPTLMVSIGNGTSVGGGVGLSGFIGYEQPNLFGQAKSGSLRWDFGRYLNSFETASGRNLEAFFRTWYSETGLPD